jgi:NAD(P)-dependent dehydrogenase (short-subunit alcohol dehydrogenase family)
MAKVALVTGANTGIGFAISRRLLADGYALGYATASDDDKHTGPLDVLRRKHGEDRIAWVHGDLSDPAVPERLVSGVVEQFGRIDVLVNNAGLSTAKPFFDLTVDDFNLTFDIDVRASFLLSQLVAKRMVDQGGSGSIVNITSVHEHIPRPNFAVYASAKAALGMLTRGLALELAEHTIRVNAVAPGVIATPRNEDDAHELNPEVPLGRPGKPEEVAALVAWICSGLRHRLELRDRRRDDPAGRHDSRRLSHLTKLLRMATGAPGSQSWQPNEGAHDENAHDHLRRGGRTRDPGWCACA